MPLADQTIKCRDCSRDFVWTAQEQEFYQSKGFTNPPGRCPECREAKKQQGFGQRQMFKIKCASCGKDAEVPFEPKGDRPVYCGECFAKQKTG